jgi:hypothetical protein
MRKSKQKVEWLPWYRTRNYKGNLTEAEKCQLDAFRTQQRHPAAQWDDLPDEVQNYIIGIKLELYDHKQDRAAGQAIIVSLSGVASLVLNYTGHVAGTPWSYICGVLLAVSPGCLKYRALALAGYCVPKFNSQDQAVERPWVKLYTAM